MDCDGGGSSSRLLDQVTFTRALFTRHQLRARALKTRKDPLNCAYEPVEQAFMNLYGRPFGAL
jgi:hypothetical protein